MSKIVKYIGSGLCAALLLWTVLSWADIVADNSKPNPQHDEHNMFVLMTEKEEVEDTTSIVYGNRVVWAEVSNINHETNIVSFVDTDGETWVAEVGNVNEFDLNRFYEIHFDDMGTADLYDDEILKIFCEVW